MMKRTNSWPVAAKYLFSLLFLLLTAPVFAQVKEAVADGDDDGEADSTLLVGLAGDTIARPWPQSVQHRLGRLLTSDMFQTSQVGLLSLIHI